MALGFTIRLCFDPMIACPDWRTVYGGMLDEVLRTIPMAAVRDVSLGSFRLPEADASEHAGQRRRPVPVRQ